MTVKEIKTEEKIKEVLKAVYSIGQVDNSIEKQNMSYGLEDSFTKYIIKIVEEMKKVEEGE